MARLTKKQISQQHELLMYAADRAATQIARFRKWHEEAAAKAYDLAEAVSVAESQRSAAVAAVNKFRRIHKI